MPKKAETPKLTFAELSLKPAGELAPFLVSTVKVHNSLTEAKAKIEDTLQFDAKVVAAFERIHIDRLNKHEIPANTSFKEFLKQNAGGEVSGRVLAMAGLFNTLVLTLDKNGKPLLPEKNFDDAKVSWLEAANAIVKQARKDKGANWMTSDEVLDVVNALNEIGDAGKKLKAIRKRQKGEAEESADTETGETAPILTVGMAVEFLIAKIKNAKTMPESEAADLFGDTVRISDTWYASGISAETMNKWSGNTANGVAPHMEVITETEKDDIASLVAA